MFQQEIFHDIPPKLLSKSKLRIKKRFFCPWSEILDWSFLYEGWDEWQFFHSLGRVHNVAKYLTTVQSMEKKNSLWKTRAVFKVHLDCDFRTSQSPSSLNIKGREAHIAARKNRDRKDSTAPKRWTVPVPLSQVMQDTSFKQSLKRWLVPLEAGGSCASGRWGARLKNPEKSGMTHIKQKNQFSGKLWLSWFILVSTDGIFIHGNANYTVCFLWRTVMAPTEG